MYVLTENVELCSVDLMLAAKWEQRRIQFWTGLQRIRWQKETIYYHKEIERDGGRERESESATEAHKLCT